MPCVVEILSVGNELLIGKIPNTNAQWLAKNITTQGGRVAQITTVPDNLKAIAEALRRILGRKPNLLLITGGLGPTFDDMTLEGVAEGLRVPLGVEPEALRMVEERYRQIIAKGLTHREELTPERVKMAKLPRGAKPLPNPVGTAPGVKIEVGGCSVMILPGVPQEMEAIYRGSVSRVVEEKLKGAVHLEEQITVRGIIESDLAPILKGAVDRYPSVYVKSHPKIGETPSRIELHLYTTTRSRREAEKRLERSISQISGRVVELGGDVIRMRSPSPKEIDPI